MIVVVTIYDDNGWEETISFNLKEHLKDFVLETNYYEDNSFNRIVWSAICNEADTRFGKDNWNSYSIESIRWE